MVISIHSPTSKQIDGLRCLAGLLRESAMEPPGLQDFWKAANPLPDVDEA